MSAAAMKFAWSIDGLSSTCKLVLLALCWRSKIHEDEPGVHKCWPPMECIAADTGLSRKSVQRAINELVASGSILKETQTRSNLKTSSVYRIPGAAQFDEDSEATDQDQQGATPMGHKVPSMGQSVPPRWDTPSHKKETYKNNKKYPKPENSRQRHEYPEQFQKICEIYPQFKNLRMSKANAYLLWNELSDFEKLEFTRSVKAYRLHLREISWKTPKHMENFLKGSYWKRYLSKGTAPQGNQSKAEVSNVLESAGDTGKKELTTDQAIEFLRNSDSQIVARSVTGNWHTQLVDFVQKRHCMPVSDEITHLMENAKKINSTLENETELTLPVLRKHNEGIRERRIKLGQLLLQ